MNKYLKALGIVIIGAAICAAGIHVGETDDAPGAGLIGIVTLLATLAWAVKIARRPAS